MSVGFVTSMGGTALIHDRYGWQVAYYIYGALVLVFLVPFIVIFSNKPRQSSKILPIHSYELALIVANRDTKPHSSDKKPSDSPIQLIGGSSTSTTSTSGMDSISMEKEIELEGSVSGPPTPRSTSSTSGADRADHSTTLDLGTLFFTSLYPCLPSLISFFSS